MTKDEALKLALEALKSAAAELYRASSYCNTYEVIGNTNDAITAIQKALAAPVQPVKPSLWEQYHAAQQEHEPENEPHVSLASVQEPVAWGVFEGGNLHDMFFTKEEADNMAHLKGLHAEIRPLTTPPAAQRQWVGLTDEEIKDVAASCMWWVREQDILDDATEFYHAIEAKLKEKNAAAQPAVPDALTSADIQEHIEYVAGWNDCRQAMLEMMK